MTIVDPAGAAPEIVAIRSRGRIIAGGLGGLFALGFCLWFFNSRFFLDHALADLKDLGDARFIAITTVVSALANGWLWDKFVQNRRQFSWGWTVVGAIVAVVAANFLTWLVYILTVLVGLAVAPPVNSVGTSGKGFGPIATALSTIFTPIIGAFFMAPFTTVVTGLFTIPLAILASLAATAWCRRRLRLEGLTSYASPETRAKP